MAKLSSAPAFVLALSAMMLQSSAVAAQSTTAPVAFYNAERADTAFDLVATPLSAADCANASADYRLEMVDTTKSRIDIWRGSDCNTTEQRTAMPDTICDPITLSSAHDQNINAQTQIDFDMLDFTELLDGCTLGDGDYGIWFLSTNMAMSNEAVTNYLSMTIRLDSTAPPAPVNVVGGRGGTQINVAWEPGGGTNAGDHLEYRVYGDSGSGVDGDSCSGSTSVFTPGSPRNGAGVLLSSGTGASATINPDMFGIEENRSGYVIVVEVDQAGNESVVSELGCIARVPTSGFCDAYGENCKSCSVSRAPGLPGGAPHAVLSMIGLALLGLSRRKSRR